MKKELAEKVAKKVGDPITVVVNEGKINPTTYLRAKVWLALSKPLVRMVPITSKERMMYLVQYEKFSAFCFHCGHLGHEVTECGDGVHRRDKCEWGDWLRVPYAPLATGRDGGGRGHGRGRGRGHGGGRGDWVEDDEEEMDISLGEDDGMDVDSRKRDVIEVGGRGRVAQQVNCWNTLPS